MLQNEVSNAGGEDLTGSETSPPARRRQTHPRFPAPWSGQYLQWNSRVVCNSCSVKLVDNPFRDQLVPALSLCHIEAIKHSIEVNVICSFHRARGGRLWLQIHRLGTL